MDWRGKMVSSACVHACMAYSPWRGGEGAGGRAGGELPNAIEYERGCSVEHTFAVWERDLVI